MLAYPQHVLIVKEPVYEQVNGKLYFRGVAPKHRNDVIVLAEHAIPETVVHEVCHNYGFDEALTDIIAKRLIKKYEFLKKFPTLKSLLFRKPKYQLCQSCGEFKLLHTKYKNRVEHWIRG